MAAAKKTAARKEPTRAAKRKSETLTDRSERGPARPPTRELGATGTIFKDGFQVFEDVNVEWTNVSRRNKFINTMRRTDGTVQSALSACKFPIVASRWVVQPPPDPTKEEVRHAEFVHYCLYGMDRSWTETLNDILTEFEFGHSVLEKMYRERTFDGQPRWVWKAWEPRLQETIFKWNVDSSGHLRSITQRVWTGETYDEIPLSANRILVFSIGREGSNFQGTSLLRSAYKHWFIKDGLYKIDAIAQERHGVGIPVIGCPQGTTQEDEAIIDVLVRDLRSHERGFIVKPFGYEVGMMEFKTQMRDPLPSIKHHDEKILQSVLAQFIVLGFSQSGSRALGQAGAEFFLNSLNSYASLIEGVINRNAIPELIYVNFGPQERYPTLECVPVGGIDFLKMAQSSMMLSQVGLIRPSKATIEHFHQVLGIPKPNWNEPAIEISGKGKQGAQDKKPSQSNNQDAQPADKGALRKINSAVRLQIASLEKQASVNGPVLFTAPLEGTLKETLLMVSGDAFAPDIARRVAVEFSRRLSTAADLSYRMNGPQNVKSSVKEEADRSMSLLTSFVRDSKAKEKELVHVYS